jgi:Mg-chelatase subunit ChlD
VYWVAVTIPPKRARTTITTLEMPLAEQDGFYAYDYRLSVDARDSVDYLRMHARIVTTDALEEVQVPTHPHLNVLRSSDNVAEIWVNSTEEAQRSDFRLRFRSEGPAVSQLALPNGDRYVRYTMDSRDPAFASSLQSLPRSFLIFVDASGSMGRSGRWPLATDAVAALLELLASGEKFGVSAFRGRTSLEMSDGLSAIDETSPAKAREFLSSITPHGSTNLGPILSRAVTWSEEARALGQQPLLFLITDGRVTAGPKSLDLENSFKAIAYEADIPMSGLVIKPATRADEVAVRNLTHFNHGGFEHVFGDYAPKAVELMIDALRLPVLRDVRVSTPGAAELATANPQRILEGGELVVLAKMQGTEADSFEARLVWPGPDGGDRSLPIEVGGTPIPTDPLLHRQWVLTRIQTLLERLRVQEDPATVEELKAIAMANRVVTPYTSLLVTIPREDPGAAGSYRDETDLLADFGFAGPPGLLTGPGGAPRSAGSTSFGPRGLTPLGEEARLWESWRRDQGAQLVVDDEVDRWISEDDRAALGFASSGGTSIAFSGNLFTVFEVQGELVGVRDPLLDPATESGRLAGSVVWATFATIVVLFLVRVHRDAVRFRRKVGDSSEQDFGTEG